MKTKKNWKLLRKQPLMTKFFIYYDGTQLSFKLILIVIYEISIYFSVSRFVHK